MKEKQKKKIVAIASFLLVFSAIILFGYYRFIPSKEVAAKDTDSLNTKLPPIQQPSRQLTKMEIYLQAEKDSLAKQQQRAHDPYATGKKDIAVEPRIEHRINRLYADLDKAVNTKKSTEEKKGYTEKAVSDIFSNKITEPVLTHSTPSATQADPELQQLSNMLDKLTELQNPAKSRPPKKMDSSFTVEAVSDKTIRAVVHQDQVISNGGILKLRLAQDITVNGTLVPRGCFVYGVCRLNDERLIVQLTSIAYNNQVLPFPLTVYDMDGIEGIYMPGAVSRETGKEGADNALQSMQLGSMDAGIAAQAANAGLQTAKNLFSRKLRSVRVTAKAGHRVFLQKN
jgi:hypothetical protein